MMCPGPGCDQDSRSRFQCTTCQPPVPSPSSTAVVFTTTASPLPTSPVSWVSTYARSAPLPRSTSTRCKPSRSSRMRTTLPVRNDGTTGHDARLDVVEHLAPLFAAIPGVTAVTLGGSRARGEAGPDSDWDFGLYYRDTIDTAAIRA